jgi:hypothetical protein
VAACVVGGREALLIVWHPGLSGDAEQLLLPTETSRGALVGHYLPQTSNKMAALMGSLATFMTAGLHQP